MVKINPAMLPALLLLLLTMTCGMLLVVPILFCPEQVNPPVLIKSSEHV
jgi:hypothetical protein